MDVIKISEMIKTTTWCSDLLRARESKGKMVSVKIIFYLKNHLNSHQSLRIFLQIKITFFHLVVYYSPCTILPQTNHFTNRFKMTIIVKNVPLSIFSRCAAQFIACFQKENREKHTIPRNVQKEQTYVILKTRNNVHRPWPREIAYGSIKCS